MQLHLEHRPAPPWISEAAPVFQSVIESTGVMVALPCYGGMLTTATLRGLLETQRALIAFGLPLAVATVTNESLVTRARNSLVARFLASSASHLLFVDSDIGFGADAVLRLLGHGRPLIAGLYRSKTTEREDWVVTFPAGEDGGLPSVRHDVTTGAVEAAGVGTGFLLIHRDVLTAMVQAHPETLHRTDEGPVHALFEAGIEPGAAPGEGRYLSEDYMFCARWRALGGEVWCDPAIVLEHHGQTRLRGEPMDLFSAA
ncbi:MAG: hypothetical protein JWR10_4272 [Rubritepida sp.]|nr:hypothetical protein [Rubritepida sp.]